MCICLALCSRDVFLSKDSDMRASTQAISIPYLIYFYLLFIIIIIILFLIVLYLLLLFL